MSMTLGLGDLIKNGELTKKFAVIFQKALDNKK
jgi:hypothetical protein